MTSRLVGRLVIAFGVATFVASVVAWLVTGEFLVDFVGAPVIVVLGVYVARGSARAARVLVVVTACYAVLPLLVLAVRAMGAKRLLEAWQPFLSPATLEPVERALRVLQAPWVMPACLIVGAVAAVVTVFLAILVRRLRKAAAMPPPMTPPPPPLPPPPAGD